MDKMHSLLKRQIKKFLPEKLKNSPELEKFLNSINDAYINFDDDRRMMERSLEINSQELLEINSQLRALFKALPDYLIIIDINGKILDFKVGRENSMEIKPEKIIGRNLSDTIYSKYKNKILLYAKKALRNIASDILDLEITVNDHNYYFEFRFTSLEENKVLIIQRDITEKRRIEDEILNMKKIESIGLLAGGIAHDFNNLLTGIIGNITLSKLYLKKGRDVLDKLKAAEQAAFRAQELTKQFLTFSKGGIPVKETASIIEVIEESVHFILRGSNIEAVFNIQDDLWSVDIDKGQINQVINNLIINANQAMESGGKIEISGKNIVFEESSLNDFYNGKFIEISIKDQGIGISKANLKKIFDPYFSTKSNGIGLGLASSFGIIKKHGGHITVESEIGYGTEFHIFLPASEKKIEKKKEEKGIRLGKGNVLIMDDEEIIISILEEQLKLLGFGVVSVMNGNELIEVYTLMNESGIYFELLILDLTIKGGMGGEEAIKEVLKINSEVKVIASSGYSNNQIMANYKKYGFMGIVPKPYKIETLSAEIERVLKL